MYKTKIILVLIVIVVCLYVGWYVIGFYKELRAKQDKQIQEIQNLF